MPKLLFSTSSFDTGNISERGRLDAAGFEIVLNPYGRRLTEVEVKKMLQDDVVGMVAGVEPLTGNVLRSARSLKVLARCGIGIDNVDLATANELGILVSNTPGGPTLSVAELTLAHVLALLRNLGKSDRMVRRGEWKALMGNLLSEQTVGIVGFGRIGRRVGELVQAFGARVLANDVQTIPAETGAEGVDLDNLLVRSDVVTLHIPYSEETHHLINRDRLAAMRSTAILINTARGGLVDETALYDALRNGQIRAAGIDSFEEEPYTGPLTELENVLITAHMGSYAKEARAKMEQEATANLVAGLTNQGLL